jgi:raffinose/stachyose/melibiose transport system substrate-binding protein
MPKWQHASILPPGCPGQHRQEMTNMRCNRTVAMAVAATMAVAVAACSSSSSSSSGTGSGSGTNNGKVTLTWWHNGNTQPLEGVWQSVANEFHAANPNVTIKINAIQSDLFKTRMPIALRSNNPPDIYQQWGGGQEATHVQSGKLTDLGAYDSSWIGELGAGAKGWQVNGKQYGVPYDLHVVGFWYRKDLFTRAGISSPPTTLAELETDDTMLKAHNIVPISVGGQSQWPDAFFWEYFALRECSASVIQQAMQSVNLSASCFAKATSDLTAFMKTTPFQNAFNGTQAQTGAGSSAGLLANGHAAMELQGDWETSVLPALTTNKNVVSDLGWFPFPSIPGTPGDQKAVLGGGDGFSCTTGAAEPACANFLKYISSVPVQEKLVSQANIGLPANPGAESSLSNPALKQVAQARDNNQVDEYFDIILPQDPGLALDAAIANFFAGKGSNATIVNSVSSSSGH